MSHRHWCTLLKMTGALLVQFTTHRRWGVSQTQSDTLERGVCTRSQTPLEEKTQLISVVLIKSHNTLTNICTAFVNSAVANVFSCHRRQQTDDIVTSISQSLPFDFEGCIRHRRGERAGKAAAIRVQHLIGYIVSHDRDCGNHIESWCVALSLLTFTILQMSLLFPCCLSVCVSSGTASQALNSTFPLRLPVLRRRHSFHSASRQQRRCLTVCCDVSWLAPCLLDLMHQRGIATV